MHASRLRGGDLRWLSWPGIGSIKPAHCCLTPPHGIARRSQHPLQGLSPLQRGLSTLSHPPPPPPRVSHPSTHTRYPEGFAHGWREMELIREAEWIITCFLKRAVCSRLLWSGLFIGCVSNLNKESEFHRFAPGNDAGWVPVGCRPPSLMLPRHPQPLGGCSNTFCSKSPV